VSHYKALHCTSLGGMGSEARIPALSALFVLAMLGTAFAVCPGTVVANYTMTQNETATTTSCIVTNTANITINCANFTVTITGATAVPAIDINAANVTLQNCVINETNANNYVMGALTLRPNANSTIVRNVNISSVGRHAIFVNNLPCCITAWKFTT